MRKPKSEEHKQKLRKPNNKSWVCDKAQNISILVNKCDLEYFLDNNKNFIKGRIISEEQKNNQRIKMSGRKPWNKGLIMSTLNK